MSRQETLFIIKPDAVSRGNIGNILTIFEKTNLTLVSMQLGQLYVEDVARLYPSHINQPHYPKHEEFMTSGFVVFGVLTGNNAIEVVRFLVGPTDPALAPKTTIRGMFGTDLPRNAIHSSDSQESYLREITALTF